jgi:hypothetical protein
LTDILLLLSTLTGEVMLIVLAPLAVMFFIILPIISLFDFFAWIHKGQRFARHPQPLVSALN